MMNPILIVEDSPRAATSLKDSPSTIASSQNILTVPENLAVGHCEDEPNMKRIRLDDGPSWTKDEVSRPAAIISAPSLQQQQQQQHPLNHPSRHSSIGQRSPPQIKRSTSLLIPQSPEEFKSFVSPTRDSSCIIGFHGSFRSKSGSRRILQRSFSLSELSSRKSLDFNEDHSSHPVHSFFVDRTSNASASSFSSLSTITEISKAEEEAERMRWNVNTKMLPLKRRRTSGSEDGILSSSRETSPTRVLSAYSDNNKPVRPGVDSEVVKKFTTLDVSAYPGNHNNNSNNNTNSHHFLSSMPPPTVPSVLNLLHSSGSNKLSHRSSADDLLANLQQANLLPVYPLGPFETPTREQAMRSQCETIDVTKVIEECKLKVRLVILDLDETLLNMHTKGRWEYGAEKLGQHIRPVFLKLFPALLKAGIPVGIATFSSQESLVEGMLMQTFGAEVKLGENVFVRGCREGDNVVSTQDSVDDAADDGDDTESGKRKHIQCILDRLAFGKDVTSEQVLFVDDDLTNSNVAQTDGHRVVHFRDTWTDELFLRKCLDALI